MKRLFVLTVGFLAIWSSGCASARYVQKAGDQGVVAIPTNSDAWPDYHRTNALKLIEGHVGASYEIVEEKEVTTGTATTNTQNTNREATINPVVPFLPAERQTTTTTTTSQALTEYHIHYRKRNSAGVATAPVTPGIPGVPSSPATVVPAGAVQTPGTVTTPATPGAVSQQGSIPPPDLSGIAGTR